MCNDPLAVSFANGGGSIQRGCLTLRWVIDKRRSDTFFGAGVVLLREVSKLKYQDPPMTFRPHGVTVSAELDGKEIIFATSQPMTTDRAGCFIGVVKIVDGKVSEFAGSAHPRGQNGTMYFGG